MRKKKENGTVSGISNKKSAGRHQPEQDNPFVVEISNDSVKEPAAEASASKKEIRKQKKAEKRAAKKNRPVKEKKQREDVPKRKKVVYEGGISGDLIYVILMILAITAALGFAVTVFFKVSVIEIRGTERTSSAQIRAVSGLEEGDKMLFLNRFEIKENIFEEIPYVDEIRIRQIPPSKVVIEVTECVPVAAISNGGIYYLINDDAKLLEYFPITGPSDYPVVTGLEVQTNAVGKTIDLGDELRLVSLKAVVASLATDTELCEDISEINMEKLYDVWFTYDGRLRVALGEADKLEKKLKLFKEVLTKLERTDKGTVGLKNTDTVTFLPD